MTDKPLVDLEALLERVEHDVELLADLVEIYEEDAEMNLQEIKCAIEARDAERLERSAHSLKGSSSNLDAPIATELAFTLEKAGRENNLQDARQIYDQLEDAVAKALVILKKYVADKS